MWQGRLLGAAALLVIASTTTAEVTTVWATVTKAGNLVNTTSGAAASTSAEPTITTTFNAAQTSLYYAEVVSYLSGSAYAALGSVLASELPSSIYEEENSVGFAGLSTEYGSSFTRQSWYSYVIGVHTQVESALESIVEDVATKLVNATLVSTTRSTFKTPTTAAATVTQASNTLATTTTTTGLAVASGSPGGSAGGAAASQQSTGAAAQATGSVQQVLGFGAVAVAGIVGAVIL